MTGEKMNVQVKYKQKHEGKKEFSCCAVQHLFSVKVIQGSECYGMLNYTVHIKVNYLFPKHA